MADVMQQRRGNQACFGTRSLGERGALQRMLQLPDPLAAIVGAAMALEALKDLINRVHRTLPTISSDRYLVTRCARRRARPAAAPAVRRRLGPALDRLACRARSRRDRRGPAPPPDDATPWRR